MTWRRSTVTEVFHHPSLKKARKTEFLWLGRGGEFRTYVRRVVPDVDTAILESGDDLVHARAIRFPRRYLVEVYIRTSPPEPVVFNPGSKKELKSALSRLTSILGKKRAREVMFRILGHLDKIREEKTDGKRAKRASGKGSKRTGRAVPSAR